MQLKMDSSNQIYSLRQPRNTGSAQVVCHSPFHSVISTAIGQSKKTPPTYSGFQYRRTEIHPRNSAAFQGQSLWQGQEISAANVRQSCGCNNALPSAAPHPPNPLSVAELEEPGLFVIPRSHTTRALPDLFNSFSALANETGTKPTNVQSLKGNVKRAEWQK